MSVAKHDRASFMLIGFLVSLAAMLAAAVTATSARADFSDYGIESASASLSSAQAGDHADLTLSFTLKTDPSTPPLGLVGLHEPYARTKDLKVDLPPGLVGNPNAIPTCSSQQFSSFTVGGPGCPQDSQVGVVRLSLYAFNTVLVEPIFNMDSPSQDTVARLGYYAGTLPNFINIRVRSDSDYGLTASLEGLPANENLVSATTELWAVPASSSHDTLRLTAREAYPEAQQESPARPSGLEPKPFLTNPTRCAGPLAIAVSADSYQLPGQFSTKDAPLPEMEGCDKVEFDPNLSVVPTSRRAAAPTGLDAKLVVPQNETVNGLGTAPLRNATVLLPEGLAISPSAADGLEACSADRVGLGRDVSAACPAAAKIGTAEFDVPALSRQLEGAIYQRTPEPGNLFRIWLVADELGVHVKIPGEIRTDPRTGQITSIFVDAPQVPVEELNLHFKGGSQGVLANPAACGTYTSRFELTPWSSQVPVVGETPMTIDQGCTTGGFAPRVRAGTVNPAGGSFSSFVLDVLRSDGEQDLAEVALTLPPGLLAKLAGVPLCPEAGAATGACQAASRIGSVAVAAGSGPTPLLIPQPGKTPTAVYLGGPYKGAPYSLVVVTPAQAGPFDLGTIVVRAGLFVDSTTAQVTVKSDPLPQILEGVPISYRDVHVEIDRANFVLNPTSCDPMSIETRMTSASGSTARPSPRFQVGSCGRLRFKPKLRVSLKGETKRGGYPRLRTVLSPRPGANISRAAVALPRSAFLAQEHIGTVCTRVQFAADACPSASIYGKARAFTPLLGRPLEGPVYLRSSDNELPDLVVALRGPVSIDLVGLIDSVNGGIRTVFPSVPDAPVSKFVLTMRGGKKSLIVNSVNLCARRNRARVRFVGQNGKSVLARRTVRARCD